MAIKYTGDVERDFVYGMIPHHNGALEMCNVTWRHLCSLPVSSMMSAFQILKFNDTSRILST